MRAERKTLLSGVAAGLGGVVEEVSEGDDHVGVADARLRGDADLQLQGHSPARAAPPCGRRERRRQQGFSHAPRSERKRQAPVTSAE